MLGERLHCEREDANNKDPYVITVIKGCDTVEHVPRQILVAYSLFLRWEGQIGYIIMALRQSTDFPNKVSCSLMFEGNQEDIEKIFKNPLLQKSQSCGGEPADKSSLLLETAMTLSLVVY